MHETQSPNIPEQQLPQRGRVLNNSSTVFAVYSADRLTTFEHGKKLEGVGNLRLFGPNRTMTPVDLQ